MQAEPKNRRAKHDDCRSPARPLISATVAFLVGAVSLCAFTFALANFYWDSHPHPICPQIDFYNTLCNLSDHMADHQKFLIVLLFGHIIAGGIIGLRTRSVCSWIRKRFARSMARFAVGAVILPLQTASVIVVMDMSLQAWVESTIGFPADGKLIAEFQRKRLRLDKITVALEKNPSLDRIGSSDGEGDRNEYWLPVLKSDQIWPYRLLLRSAGILQVSVEYDGGIRFPIWSSPAILKSGDFADSGNSKGYEYRTVPPKTTPWSLNGFNLPSEENRTVYRHIEGNWYLYYNCWHGREISTNGTSRENPSLLPVPPARAIISEALMSTNVENSVRPLRGAVVTRSGNGGGAGNGGIEQITWRLPA